MSAIAWLALGFFGALGTVWIDNRLHDPKGKHRRS